MRGRRVQIHQRGVAKEACPERCGLDGSEIDETKSAKHQNKETPRKPLKGLCNMQSFSDLLALFRSKETGKKT